MRPLGRFPGPGRPRNLDFHYFLIRITPKIENRKPKQPRAGLCYPIDDPAAPADADAAAKAA